MSPSRPDAGQRPSPASENGGRIILYCAADLLWATRIKEAATALGIPARPVRSLDMLTARLADSQPPSGPGIAGLIVDLEHPDGVRLVAHLRAQAPDAPGIPIVAFGPHVATQSLQAAADAGASAVMARGAFAANLGDLLTRMARRA